MFETPCGARLSTSEARLEKPETTADLEFVVVALDVRVGPRRVASPE